MAGSFYRVVFVVFVVWGVACATKAVLAIRADRGHTFGMWDGGMLRVGKTLTPLGTRLKIATGSLMALTCVIAGALPFSTGVTVLCIVAAVASVACDLATTAR